MTKVLLLADNRTNLITPLLQGMKDEKIDVTYVDASDLIVLKKYPTTYHRIKAKIIDGLILRRKRNWGVEKHIAELCEENFDQIIVMIPAMLSEPAFLSLNSAFKEKFTCIFLDSINKAPSGKIALKFCSDFFSFDKEDTKYEGVEYLPTYIEDNVENKNNKTPHNHYFGVFAIDSEEDRRYQKIEALAICNPEIKGCVYIFSESSEERRETINQTQIIHTNRRLVGEQLVQCILDAHCILDIVDERQTGLSPRIGNAYSYSRKLITNNTSANAETWFKDNMLVINESSLTIPLSFIEKEYVFSENPNSVSNWINKVLAH
ncbi:hypothetical protein [Enterovibrio calviensis]|uniref:hypothetical protein n=1 Tax=Enterovibrio calviensis TaxID=91359 RepID=UPI000486E3E0|nr:hypothetical protein [Enterovibrio calviensis]